MTKIPSITLKRLAQAVPKFQKILAQAKDRDANESDTVTIVVDVLVEVFGFDKYTEITREYAIQNTFCDIAVRTDKKVDYLIEVKAIGIDLRDNHLRQAINYAAGEGISWVVLTNGINWQIHRVTLDGKVSSQMVLDFNILEINHRNDEDREKLFLLCKRGIQKDRIDKYYERKQSVNRYMIGALLHSDVVITTIRRELQKMKVGLKVKNEEIESLLLHEVIKREVLASENTKEAVKNIKRATLRAARKALQKPKPAQTDGQTGGQSDGDADS